MRLVKTKDFNWIHENKIKKKKKFIQKKRSKQKDKTITGGGTEAGEGAGAGDGGLLLCLIVDLSVVCLFVCLLWLLVVVMILMGGKIKWLNSFYVDKQNKTKIK